MKRRDVELSARMKALTGLVTPGRVVCDIGCDHGFVSIYLVQKGISEKVFAMDVRSGPLSQARMHILEYGLEKSIETRLSDGLQKLEAGEADCMVCAGMGGPLMMKILEEGRKKVMVMKELILQPQSEIAEFRAYLRENGYHIMKEDMVFEDGKFYPMMKVIPIVQEDNNQGGMDFSDCPGKGIRQRGSSEDTAGVDENRHLFDTFGQYLLEHKHPVLKQYLEHSVKVMESLKDRLSRQQGEKAKARIPELESELNLIYRALTYFEVS